MTKKKSPGESRDQILHAVRGEFYKSIADLLRTARSNAYRAVNFVMVEAYWNVGRMIVEEEQQGKERAGYGEALLRGLSQRLNEDFGKGFGVSNLFAFRQFYLAMPVFRALRGISSNHEDRSQGPSLIPSALRRELTWTHYRLLIRVEKPEAREWYMNEAADQNWSTRALERQINSLYYERLLISRDKAPVTEEMRRRPSPSRRSRRTSSKTPTSWSFSECRMHTNSARPTSNRPSSESSRPSCSNLARALRL